MEVVLLTQEHCAFCDDAKRMLDRLTADYDFTVREVDLGSPEGEALARDAGVLFPPGIVVDSDPVSYGRPSERRVRREFDRRTVAQR
ncbi:MAG: glutaredoxin family protein [Actinobacteria bacterium]|nr:glutaredoxin family protein [Actinomycetota bacterium]